VSKEAQNKGKIPAGRGNLGIYLQKEDPRDLKKEDLPWKEPF